jgi:lysyl-tRNA synthetase class I
VAKELTNVQKQFLKSLSEKLSSIEWEGELIHGSIHEIVKGSEEFTPKDCFQAIYKIFLAKDYGPQVGWFFSALKKDFVVNRLKEVI